MVTDEGKARLIQNTPVRNGGGLAFHDRTEGKVRGNIIGESKVGLLFSWIAGPHFPSMPYTTIKQIMCWLVHVRFLHLTVVERRTSR